MNVGTVMAKPLLAFYTGDWGFARLQFCQSAGNYKGHFGSSDRMVSFSSDSLNILAPFERKKQDLSTNTIFTRVHTVFIEHTRAKCGRRWFFDVRSAGGSSANNRLNRETHLNRETLPSSSIIDSCLGTSYLLVLPEN